MDDEFYEDAVAATVEELLSSSWPACEQCGKPAWDHYENENISRFKIAPYGPFGLTADHQPVWSERSE